MNGRWLSVAAACMCVAVTARAQFPEDALRFATPGIGVGARSLGMGNAFTGIANDYSAIYWNPAGLAQLEHGEFSFGLSHLITGDESSFFGNVKNYTNSSTSVNAFGLTVPVETRRGSLVFALGYNRQSNFTTGMEFSGFNPVSSIVQAWAPDNALTPSSLSGNLAWELYLADIDTNTSRWISPFLDSLSQLGTVLEGGGLDNWSVAGAVDVGRNLSVGATLSYVAGSYKYDRTYTERDDLGIYSNLPFDLAEFTVSDNLVSDLSGFGARLGLMYREPNRFRFGVAVRVPTTYSVKEDFGTTGRTYFDNNDVMPADGPYTSTGHTEYDVVTPWVFSAGASVIVDMLMLSGDVEFTDWKQLSFENTTGDLLALNQEIKTLFRATMNAHVGAEVDLRNAGVRLRGGFMYHPSPFQGDPATFDQKFATGGLGFMLGQTTMLDVAYARGWWDTYRVNYDATSRTDEHVTTDNIVLTLTYRF